MHEGYTEYVTNMASLQQLMKFVVGQIFEKLENCTLCKIGEKNSFWQLTVSQNTLMSDTKYPKERIFNSSSFVQKLQLKQGEECQICCDL